MEKTICELFAGVGGFRLGFEKINTGWKTVWFSQWEPGAKNQWAHECYIQHFGNSVDMSGELHTCEDIAVIDKKVIPNHNLLVGGFPCQDYSVAQSLSSSKGIEGKKGVLWWQIRDTIEAKMPAFCIFENVDRLLKSPSKQRGRDFGIILWCLNDLNYSVEWRVVNAAEYGAAQKRKRVFIFAYRNDTVYSKYMSRVNPLLLINQVGFMSKAFPMHNEEILWEVDLMDNLLAMNNQFKFDFKLSGFMRNGRIYTANARPIIEKSVILKDILQSNVGEEFYIKNEIIDKWIYLKGAKKIKRISKTGHEYIFSEGAISFPDSWDKPGRTMLTSESTLNRSTHIVCDPGTGRLRTLTPIEAERLQGFDDDWTNSGMPNRMRFFCMGNALVVPMITRMARVLDNIIEDEL